GKGMRRLRSARPTLARIGAIFLIGCLVANSGQTFSLSVVGHPLASGKNSDAFMTIAIVPLSYTSGAVNRAVSGRLQNFAVRILQRMGILFPAIKAPVDSGSPAESVAALQGLELLKNPERRTVIFRIGTLAAKAAMVSGR